MPPIWIHVGQDHHYLETRPDGCRRGTVYPSITKPGLWRAEPWPYNASLVQWFATLEAAKAYVLAHLTRTTEAAHA